MTVAIQIAPTTQGEGKIRLRAATSYAFAQQHPLESGLLELRHTRHKKQNTEQEFELMEKLEVGTGLTTNSRSRATTGYRSTMTAVTSKGLRSAPPLQIPINYATSNHRPLCTRFGLRPTHR